MGAEYLLTAANPGRVKTQRFQSNGQAAYSSRAAIRPEEVLFGRLNAPTRYEENDFYFAHESLPPNRPLPSTELLEAIHAYSSDFYDRATVDRGGADHRSMDETALIAMGILLEEMAKESLDETGDLVLVEGENFPGDGSRSDLGRGQTMSRKRARSTIGSVLESSGDDGQSAKRRSSKRRTLSRKVSTVDGDTADEKG